MIDDKAIRKGHIKSKKRVREQGEVFTQEREVKNILALTQATDNIFWRFLEPACGDGNFLVEIVRQRLINIKQNPRYRLADRREFAIIHMISSIYGVDIAEDNIAECKKRIKDEIYAYTPKKSTAAFLLALHSIIETNIQLGDMLNGKDKIFFVEYAFHFPDRKAEYLSRCTIKQRVYSLIEMENGLNKPIDDLSFVRPRDMKPIDLHRYYPKEINIVDTGSDQATLFNMEVQNV